MSVTRSTTVLCFFSWLTVIRFGCICGRTGLDQVRRVSQLVLPLHYVHRSRLRLYRLLFLGLPVQETGWCVYRSYRTFSRRLSRSDIRYFRRDWTTTEGTRSERTKPLPSDYEPACGPHDGFIRCDLRWVRILPSPGFYLHLPS